MYTDSWNITFGPVDPLNPGCGYEIRVERNGETVLWTSLHPVTGHDLDFAGCLEVAGFYGPVRR